METGEFETATAKRIKRYCRKVQEMTPAQLKLSAYVSEKFAILLSPQEIKAIESICCENLKIKIQELEFEIVKLKGSK